MDTVQVHAPLTSHCVNDGLGVGDVVVTGGPVAGVQGVAQRAGVVAVNSSPPGPVHQLILHKLLINLLINLILTCQCHKVVPEVHQFCYS